MLGPWPEEHSVGLEKFLFSLKLLKDGRSPVKPAHTSDLTFHQAGTTNGSWPSRKFICPGTDIGHLEILLQHGLRQSIKTMLKPSVVNDDLKTIPLYKILLCPLFL
jgi:hypothetical protein